MHAGARGVGVGKELGVEVVGDGEVLPVAGDVVEGQLGARGGAAVERGEGRRGGAGEGAQGAAAYVRAVTVAGVADVGVGEVALRGQI